MDESILNALMQLFGMGAVMRSHAKNIETVRQIVEQYLNHRLNKELTQKYLELYDEYVKQFLSDFENRERRKKKLSAYFVKVLKIAEQVNETLEHLEKIIVIIRLIEFFSDEIEKSVDINDFVSTIAAVFNINSEEYLSIKNFILEKFNEITRLENLLYVLPNNQIVKQEKVKYIISKGLDTPIVFLFIPSIEGLFFKYNGSLNLKLTSRSIEPHLVYYFDSGAIIRGSVIKPIYQTQIIRYFLNIPQIEKVKIVAHNIEFYYPKTDYGIRKFNFEAESGQMIGIVGASGSGKSTLLNLLIGKYPLHSGKITINGYDLYEFQDRLISLIGYVPQDDLLIEELTVYQNIYYSAKFCFGDKSEEEIQRLIESILKKLDLYEIRNLKVGSKLSKLISGGQRKRLNIALELIREPSILLVDEPTSGLSSMDSDIVMHLLRKQAISGRLVIVNIHQPSSDIFKLFDQIIVLDKGGYPVYKGNPLDGIIYFKQIANYVDSDTAECPVCGNVNTNLMLEIIEDRIVNEFGKYTDQRKTSPKEWYILYRVNLEIRERIKTPLKTTLPRKEFRRPSFLKQFFLFFKRDFQAKLANKQYMLINLLEAPLLAIILSYFARRPNEDGFYSLMTNTNLPIFLFMAVVVAIFLGLTLSAEEIIKDRKIIEREKFLQLSRFAYLNSKVLVLMLFSLYQVIIFVFISKLILEFNAVSIKFIIILFITAIASNILGLIISSTLDSVVAIYITIPLIVIPQILLGGLMINYDDLPNSLTNKKYTPLIADIMFSRWAYEAMAVVQFRDNEYERIFFDIDKLRSDGIYFSSFYIPELKNLINKAQLANDHKLTQEYEYLFSIIKGEFEKLNNMQVSEQLRFTYLDYLKKDKFLLYTDSLLEYLSNLQNYFNLLTNKYIFYKDSLIKSIEGKIGREGLFELKQKNYNNKLADLVLNRSRLKQIIVYKGELIRKKDPIFMDPNSHIGRAHFYAAYKFLGNRRIDTFIFNVVILLLISIFQFIILYYDVIRKFLQFFDKQKLR